MTVVPPLNLDADEDDDFGDFEEPEAFTEHQTSDKFEAFASSSGWASLDSSPRGHIDQILIGVIILFTLFFDRELWLSPKSLYVVGIPPLLLLLGS